MTTRFGGLPSGAVALIALCLIITTHAASAQGFLQRGGALDNGVRALLGQPSAQEQDRIDAAADDTQCKSYGFKPQTEGYANCRLKLAELRANDKAAAAGARSKQPTQSFMCKNAIVSGDRGGVLTFC